MITIIDAISNVVLKEAYYQEEIRDKYEKQKKQELEGLRSLKKSISSTTF